MDKMTRNIIFGIIFLLVNGSISSAQDALKDEINQLLTDNVEKIYYLHRPELKQGQRNASYGIAIGKNDIVYAGNFRRQAVIAFDKDLKPLFSLKAKYPHGVSVDSKGNIYVATYEGGRVHKFSKEGVESVDWDIHLREAEKIRNPVAVDFDAKDNVYIADYFTREVIKVSGEGEYLLNFDINAFADPAKFFPHDICVAGKFVYVAGRIPYNNVHVFSSRGKYIRSWDTIEEPFDPLSVEPFDKNILLVPNYSNSKVHVFNRKGRHFGSFGGWGPDAGKFFAVTNVAVDNQGWAYFVEEKGNRIQKINLQPVIEKMVK